MDMEISSAQQEAMTNNNNQLTGSDQKLQERRLVWPQPVDQALKCPRCESTNTKFCYYNNYSLSQPRYFCKGCRRYWTQGGSLRNVPVGGGCRKNNKRSTSSSSSKKPQLDQALITTDTSIINPLLPNILSPPFSHNPSDLTLALNRLQNPNNFLFGSLNPNPNPSGTGFLDILKSGFLDSTNYPTSGLFNNPCNYNATSDVGFNGASASTTTASETVQGQFENNDHNDVSNVVGVNSARDYWNGAGNTYWHGLLNSSLM